MGCCLGDACLKLGRKSGRGPTMMRAPDVSIVALAPASEYVLVLATDGLWNYIPDSLDAKAISEPVQSVALQNRCGGSSVCASSLLRPLCH